MMMVSGISIYSERVPAVVVPPTVMAQVVPTSTVATDLKPVQPYAAAEFQQHPNPYDRTLQESYDMHGRMIHNHEPTGTQLNKRI
jgi:hypothetical protein